MSPALIIALLLLLLSSLAKEYIPLACLLLALLSTAPKIRTQQRKLEKLEAEYRGQISINRAAAERHSIAYRKLLQSRETISATTQRGREATTCTRPHYDHVAAEMQRENAELKKRARNLFAQNTALKAEREIQNTSIERLQSSVERLVARKKGLLEEVSAWKTKVEKMERRERREKKVQNSI